MFHVGKVLKVFKNNDKEVIGFDSSVQAMIAMWDENIVTVTVEQGIGEKIKEADIVLIDYSPSSPNIPVPKQIATKILRGETAKKAWKEYEEFKTARKREKEAQEYGNSFTNVR